MTTTQQHRIDDRSGSIEATFQRHKAEHLWTYLANLMLGAWLLASTAMIGHTSTSLRWSDLLSDAAIVVLGVIALYPKGDFWGR